ncbi:hypothetical protein EMIT0158MI4_270027 [Burkholderia ambifaria]
MGDREAPAIEVAGRGVTARFGSALPLIGRALSIDDLGIPKRARYLCMARSAVGRFRAGPTPA